MNPLVILSGGKDALLARETFVTDIYIYILRKKGRNYISRQACFVNRFTLQGFNERIFI